MMYLNASILSKKLSRLFSEKESKGKIHSIFQNAINIELEEGFLFNCISEKLPPNPRSIVLPIIEWDRIQDRMPSVGLPVHIKRNYLEIPSIAVKILFGGSMLWDPSPFLSRPPIYDAEIRLNLEIIAMVIQQDDKKEDAKEHTRRTSYKEFQNRIYKAANNLFVSISNCNFKNVSESVFQLAGVGPGLTPSGDDVLSGVMAAGVFCGLAHKVLYPDIQKINKRICSIAFGRTTSFSQILLADSSIGEVVRPVGQLLQALLCCTDKVFLVFLTRKVMTLGGYSGKDIVKGILLGTDAFLKMKDKLI